MELFLTNTQLYVNWWTGAVWIIVMYSDGTHSLQSIHCWTSDAMLHFSKSDEDTNSSISWMAWGWVNFHFGVNYSFKITTKIPKTHHTKQRQRCHVHLKWNVYFKGIKWHSHQLREQWRSVTKHQTSARSHAGLDSRVSGHFWWINNIQSTSVTMHSTQKSIYAIQYWSDQHAQSG